MLVIFVNRSSTWSPEEFGVVLDAIQDSAALALSVPPFENGGSSDAMLTRDDILPRVRVLDPLWDRGGRDLEVIGIVYDHPHRISSDGLPDMPSGDRIAKFVMGEIEKVLPDWVKNWFVQFAFCHISFASGKREKAEEPEAEPEAS